MSNLNGAYYGPSIPPPAKSSHRPGRSGSSCCCNPFSCCCGCLFNCLCTCVFQVICTILVIIALAAFIFWLIFRPNQLKFHASDARLTEFNLDNGTLYYNLALDLTIRNPNKRIGVYYDNIEVRASYEGERFASTNLPTFYQGHKNTTTFDNVVLRGQQLLFLNNDDISEYNKERSSGTFDIDVKIYLRMRFKVGLVKTTKFKPKIHCDLKLPLNANGTTATTFQTTKCDLDW